MPTNLTKVYNDLLDMLYTSEGENIKSIRGVFDRDFGPGKQVRFRSAYVYPTTADGQDTMDRLFRHLTTCVVNESTKARKFESDRSIRIHWIKHHLEKGEDPILVFEVINEKRVYLLDKDEKYVIVLEPKSVDNFYLLTAYRLESSNYKKIMNKFERRGKKIV